MRVECGEGDMARQVADVKHYIGKLDEMEGIVKEHQRLFFCRCKSVCSSRFCLYSPRSWSVRTAPGNYSAILEDLKKRRIGAGLLLGELSGRKDARIAEIQGQAETWTTEFLAEIQRHDAIERRKEVEDLLTVSHLVRSIRRGAY